MKAIIVREPGCAEQLAMGEVPAPELTEEGAAGPGEGHRPEPGRHPAAGEVSASARRQPAAGLEMAGVVERVGENAPAGRKATGFGLLPGRVWKYCDSGEMAMPIPENLSFEEAAAVPEVFLTAYRPCFGWALKGAAGADHAGASGVGTASSWSGKRGRNW